MAPVPTYSFTTTGVESSGDIDGNLTIHNIDTSRTALSYDEGSSVTSVVTNIFKSAASEVDLPATAGSNGAVTQLVNGDIVVAVESAGEIVFTMYSSSGRQVQGATVFSNVDSGIKSDPDIIALRDGGFAIAYTREFSVTDEDSRIAVFNARGTLQGSVQTLSNSGASSSSDIKLAALADGTVAAVWTETSGAQSELHYAILGDDGTFSVTARVFETASSINRDVEVVTTSRGFNVFFETDNGDLSTNIARGVFGEAGYEGLETIEPFADPTTASQNESNVRAVALPEAGLIGIAYEQGGRIYVQLINEDIGQPAASVRFEVDAGLGTGVGRSLEDLAYVFDDDDGLSLIVAMRNDSNGDGMTETVRINAAQSMPGGVSTGALGGLNGFTPTDFADELTGNSTTGVNYQSARMGVIAHLDGTTRGEGGAAGDLLIGMEDITGSSFADELHGNDRDNLLKGSGGDDTLFGGDGNDNLYGSTGDETHYGGSGNDTFLGSGGVDTLYGGDGDDYFLVELDGDSVNGGAGNDIVLLGLGGDVEFDINAASLGTYQNIEGFVSSDGDDLLVGNGQANTFSSGEGDDTLIGNGGADSLDGGEGADELFGGEGNDIYVVDNAGDVVTETLAFSAGGGIDTVVALVDYVQPENVEIVRLGVNVMSTQDFDATGNDAPGTLVGNAGNNTLTGRGGNDQINGNDGNDVLIGNTGVDTLVGGAGADTFVYNSISESRTGSAARDVINGFDRGQDQIDLSAMDANLGGPGDAAFTFIGTSGFSGSAGELRLQGLGGANAVIVEGDLRGDGVADFQIFVNLITTLGADDFIL